MFLTGSDIIFAFVKIKEYVVTHRQGKTSVDGGEVNNAGGLSSNTILEGARL